MLPSEYYSKLPVPIHKGYNWEAESANLPYRTDEGAELLTKVNILHKVVSQLLLESEAPAPDIAAVINKRFWDLV